VDKFPDLLQSFHEVGEINGEIAELLGLPVDCKVLCGGNDAVLSAFSAGINKPGEILLISGTCDIMMVCLSNAKGSANYNIRSHILPDLWITLFVLNTGGKSLEWFHSVFCSEMTEDQFYNVYVPSVIDKKIEGDIPSYTPFLQGSRYSVEALKAGFSDIDVNTTRDDFLMSILKGNNQYLASHLEDVAKVLKPDNKIKLTGGAGNIRNMEKVRRKWIGDYQFEYIEQSSLQGAAKLGKLYFENQNK
jgi:xylulokinase